MAGYNVPGYMAGNPQVSAAYQALLQAMQQPVAGQQMLQQAPQAAFQGDNRIFVNGPASALNIAMGVNSVTPPILDANNKTFYLVQTDGAGTKTYQAFDYAPHEDKPAEHVEYATKDDIKDLREQIAALGAKPAARPRKAASDAE